MYLSFKVKNTIVVYLNSDYISLNVYVQSITLCMVIKMADNYSIGKRVKELRTNYGLSQEKLALQAEITTAYLGQIERGEKNPTVVTVGKICNALGVSLSDFFSSQVISVSEDDVTLKQILFELKDCTVNEKQEILQIIQHALKLKRIE